MNNIVMKVNISMMTFCCFYSHTNINNKNEWIKDLFAVQYIKSNFLTLLWKDSTRSI